MKKAVINDRITYLIPDRLTQSTPWHGHIPFGFWLVKYLKPTLIVELGVHAGDSYCAFCQAVEYEGLPCWCYGIDTWKGDKHAGYYDDTIYNELRAYHDPKYGHFSSLVRANFDEAVGSFADGSIDLLHIDGLHTYEAVRHDFETWAPKLSKRAIVLFHDINERSGDFGVWRFWAELKREFRAIEFNHSYGLGVLLYGEEVPESVSSLTGVSEQELAEIQRYFKVMGERVQLYWQNKELSRRVQESLSGLDVMKSQLENFDSLRQDLLLQLREAEARADKLQTELDTVHGEWEADVKECERYKRELSAQADALRGLVADKDSELERLSRLVSELELQLKLTQDSTSWRITAPARALGRVVRKLLHLRVKPSLIPSITGAEQTLSTKVISYRKYRVLFVSGLPRNTASFRYRVQNVVEALLSLGNQAEILMHSDLRENSIDGKKYEILVLYRVAWDSDVERLISQVRRAGGIVIFDTDDYIFDHDVANESWVDGIRFLDQQQRALYHEGVSRYRRTLVLSDYFTGSTGYLADEAATLCKMAATIPNGVDSRRIEKAQEVLQLRTQTSEPDVCSDHGKEVVIGYASGTLTHQRDFAVVVPVLKRIMQEFPFVKLRVVGELKLEEFPDLTSLNERIQLRPIVPFDELLKEIAAFDINIAPLEIGNPYCEAKSEAKYLDAALVAVPTVASATRSFRDAIQHEKTGFLCSSEDDWYGALEKLIRDPALRRKVGTAARNHVLEKYSPKALESIVALTYKNFIRHHRANSSVHEDGLLITVVVPPVFRGSGGHSKIFSIVKGLAKRGHFCTVVVEETSRDFSRSADVVSAFGLNHPNIRVEFGLESLSRCDALVATFWKTAYLVKEMRDYASSCFYFIQDYEPYFYPMGSEYILAEQSYKLGLTGISYGPWCKKVLRDRHGIDTEHIDFYIDKSIYEEKNGPRRDNLIAFFIRPHMPRRCFQLGILALEKLLQLIGNNMQIEIATFGDTMPAGFSPSFKYTSLGVLSPTELAALYSRATLGLVFSTTNPSMVPFEMMACGLPVVDLDYGDNHVNYGGYENACLCPPDPDEIALRLRDLLLSGEQRRMLALNGKRYAQSLPSEDEVIGQLEHILRSHVGNAQQ